MAYGWVRRGNVVRNMAWYTHKVKKGDTLASIAKSVKPAQTVAYIKKWNGLNSDKVSAGQTIRIFPYYIVQWGDTASDIAKSFGTTYQELWKLNQHTLKSGSINLIYPKEHMRLPEGREPDEKPPKPKPEPKPKPKPKKEDPPKPPGDGNDRTGKSTKDDDFPAHRKTDGDYFLRIGDCQFAIPPEFIQVQRVNTIQTGGFMRQTQSFKYKNGQSETRIELQLWFSNLEEINGFEVPSPIKGQKFYMDGLRPLLAQFKRMPFLPIINEYLNDVMDIHAVAFSNLSFTTVEGFPDMIQANLTLYKMEVDMYIGKPSWTYDQHFMYPLFRWYYNQMLVTNKPSYSVTYLEPVEWANFTDDVKFSIINEGFLRERKATNKLKDIDADKVVFDAVTLPSDLICTGIFGSYGVNLAPLAMDMRETPTFQYMGGGDMSFYLTFETTNRDGVAILERMYSNLERYSRQYRDRFVSGYIKIKNSLINMCGVKNVMIQDLTVATVPGTPDLFRIQLSLVSYKDTQYQDQRLSGGNGKGGFNIVSSADASEVAKGNMGVADKYLEKKKEPWFITEEGISEGLLDQLELYPDLELPTYEVLNDVLSRISSYRKKKGYDKLPIDNYKTPRHLHRDYKSGSYETIYLPESAFVDPDFYFTYPDWKDIEWVDKAMIDNDALDVQLGISSAVAKTKGKANYGSGATSDAGLSRKEQCLYWAMAGVKEYGLPKESYYLLAAIALKETAFGTTGQGRPPKNMVLCYGSYDTNPDYSYGGIQKQMHYGAKRIKEALKSKGYYPKSVEDVHYLWTGGDKGAYQWASDTGWPAGVWKCYKQITADKGSYAPPNGAPSSDGGDGESVDFTVADSSILKNAEADVIIPIPKNPKEETKYAVDNGKISNNTIMKGMLHDMAKYSRRDSMVRAFPTFVLCFVDEGMWVDYRRLWNNYYTYHAIEEINLVKERGNPVDTAVIRLQNIYGALNASVRSDTKKAAAASKLPGWWQTFEHPIKNGSKWFEAWFPKVDSAMVKRRIAHIEDTGFFLRAGARVHIRLGYGSVASMMPIVFNGRVTELDVGNIAEIICQSDGLELIEPYAEWAADARTSWYSIKQEPKDIIDDFFVNRLGWDVLASYDNRIWGAKGTQSLYGIEHFGYVIGDDQKGVWDGWFTDWIRSLGGREVVNGYDARKNIYNSNGHGLATDKIFDGERNVNFWKTNKSPWDVMQMLTVIIPDFELKVHEHTFHSTVFYGQPQWYMKYGYLSIGKDTTKRSNWREVMKPSQQFHNIDSMFDIISNRVKVSDKELCTVAAPVYSFDEQPKTARTIFADPNIKPEMQKTDIVDTSLLQDYPMGDFIAEAARWVGNKATSMLASGVHGIGKLLGYNIKLDDYIVNKDSRVEQLAIQAAKTHIQWKFRTMYQGDLVIIGDAAIRPGDLFNLTDAYTQMFGQAEVGRVFHQMSMGTGFISNIKPDLIAVRKDGKRAKLLKTVHHVGAYLALRTMRIMARKYILKKPLKLTNNLTKAIGWVKSLRKVRNTVTGEVVEVSALAGPEGWVAVIGELAVWVMSELILDAIETMLTKERANVVIMPLWLKNRPYVAGIDGHKELIPGYWDETIYGKISETNNPNTADSASANGGGGSKFVPEGYTLCTPTVNQRKTDEFNPTGDKSISNRVHKGIDYGAKKQGVEGDNIMAVGKGKVVKVGWDGDGYGNYIILEHDFSDHPIKWVDRLGSIDLFDDELKKFYTLYGHLSKVKVSNGASVELGEVIGDMGNTGGSHGVHLHFEFRTSTINAFVKDLKPYFDCDPYDPAELLKKGKAYDWK